MTTPKAIGRYPLASPTEASYGSMDAAYDHFNTHLFGGSLPRCLITVARHRGAYGYFAPDRFTDAVKPDKDNTIHEIALNPQSFGVRPPKATLSTLVHEMCHLWQQTYGTPSRVGYHNKEWSTEMVRVGLTPLNSKTGLPAKAGQSMTHEVVAGGPFDRACDRFLADSPPVLYHDRWGDPDAAEAATKKTKAKPKTKYTCPACQVNAWAKPGVNLMCGDCEEAMEAED